MQLDIAKIDKIIENFLDEDVGRGDITSNSAIESDTEAEFIISAREEMIMCGFEIAKRTFHIVDSSIKVTSNIGEGKKTKAKDVMISGKGNARSILLAERVALNLLRQTCGVATTTAQFVEKTTGTNAKILDSRKTIPGLRNIQKYAVTVGGGHNHRFGLDDGILIKDNHISVCGGVEEAIKKVKANAPYLIKIEIECENLQQLEQAINAGADVIMLDNMEVETMRKAVKLNANRVILEASGNVNLKTIADIAKTGVDYISIGALTHSPVNVDIGLDMDF